MYKIKHLHKVDLNCFNAKRKQSEYTDIICFLALPYYYKI